jgi:hypothetical protein
MTVFWILVPLFVAVGAYLVWYSRRGRRLVMAFAREKGLRYRPGDDGQLAAALDEALGFDEPGLVRSFGQVRDIVYDRESVQLFRTVELLDLNRYGTSQSTHYSRVAVTFEVSPDLELFALVSPDLRCQSRLGSDSSVPQEPVTVIRSVLENQRPRCPLSVTLKRGRGLIYLEPLVTGNVRPEDLEYLIAIGRGLRTAFA